MTATLTILVHTNSCTARVWLLHYSTQEGNQPKLKLFACFSVRGHDIVHSCPGLPSKFLVPPSSYLPSLRSQGILGINLEY